MATRPAPPRPTPIPDNSGPSGRSGASSAADPASYAGSSGSASRPGAGKEHKPHKVGQYILGATLGVGSFGKVKLATHAVTGHKVAVKIINRRKIQNMDMTSRVKREIQYLKLLRHPHIIKLYEVITTPADILMVIEYAGLELFNYIVEKGKMPEDQARKFFQQIICAVEYCHRHKIVHRDLKPENLLLDEYLNVKIADFGLSNIMKDGDFLKTSCGSPNYAAPEVISGKLYAGPEIDIWSCGVILYVMLCGKLPFDDEYIPALFRKINGGIFSIPSHLSEEPRNLLKRMLVVDPVRRATIAEIRENAWFQKNLPQYLQPLPPTPSTERPGMQMTDMSNILAEAAAAAADGHDPEMTPQKYAHARGLVYTQELGIVDPEIVKELSEKMQGFDRTDVWEALKKEGDNQIKVAYQLVRDHKRMVQDSVTTQAQEDDHAMESFLASSPPAWNAGLESASKLGRSTSLKRKTQSAPAEPQDEDSWDEDDMEMEDIPDSHFEILEASLPGRIDENGEVLLEYDVPFVPGQGSYEEQERAAQALIAAQKAQRDRVVAAHVAKPKKEKSARWHFGIRSRSHPMEVMHEIYKTLQTLGMEWKKKPGFAGPWDEHGRPVETPAQKQAYAEMSSAARKEKKHKEKQQEEKYALGLFFVETRCRIGDIVIRMDLQLYRVDDENYLVDFRNVGYYRTDPDQPGFARARRGSQQDEGKEPRSGQQGGDHVNKGDDEEDNSNIQEVCSPFLFLEAACRLIVDLAGG